MQLAIEQRLTPRARDLERLLDDPFHGLPLLSIQIDCAHPVKGRTGR
jgi:hypothetical protein